MTMKYERKRSSIYLNDMHICLVTRKLLLSQLLVKVGLFTFLFIFHEFICFHLFHALDKIKCTLLACIVCKTLLYNKIFKIDGFLQDVKLIDVNVSY